MTMCTRMYTFERCAKEEVNLDHSFVSDGIGAQDLRRMEEFPPIKSCMVVRAEEDVIDAHAGQFRAYSNQAWNSKNNIELIKKAEADFFEYAKQNGIACVKHTWSGGLSPYAGDLYRADSIVRSAIRNDDIEKLKVIGLEIAEDGSFYGECFLHYAIRCNASNDIIEYLVTHGIDINKKYGDTTVLHTALSENASVDTMKCLLELGADVNAKDRNGDNVFITMLNWHDEAPELAKLFIDFGIDLNEKTADGYTLLDEAINNKCLKCAEIIRVAMK